MVGPNFDVSGRTALLTGAGRGIGLAMAQALAAGGAAVAIQDIDEAVASAEVDAIKAAGGRAIALGGDLAEPGLPERLVEATVAGLGGLDVLVNNGSIQRYAPFVEHGLEQMRRELEINTIVPTRLCQLVLPRMQERKWGRIINLGSVQGFAGNAHSPAYAMSRAAMANLTRSLGRRFARDGITVNCIAPGWFNTLRNRSDLTSPEVVAERGKHIPAGRLGEPTDCAGLCVLLCSPAGEYITGQTITVDGGMT